LRHGSSVAAVSPARSGESCRVGRSRVRGEHALVPPTLCSRARELHTAGEMKRTTLLAAIAAALGGCGPTGGTDVGNGRSISFRLQGYEAAPPAGAKSLELSTGVTLDEAWVAVDRIRLEPLSTCDTDSGEVDV